jgi:ureidoacrylate peracid hydrolase
VLRARELRYLVFVGIATNVCVESTLRDAYFHEYWPLLVTDGALQAGPPEAHTATVFNVESFFGWTIGTDSLIEALRRSPAASSQSSVGPAAATESRR